MRACGADLNPYLAMAACLIAGLDGIENQIEPPPPVDNAYAGSDAPPLPRTLREATARLRASALARAWLGDGFVNHYVATREWECRQFEKAVTDWELTRYFEAV
jgi:glutamine synthetase